MSQAASKRTHPPETVSAVLRLLEHTFDGLRDYQGQAILAGADHLRKSKEPILLQLPTGAGKSHVLAGLAAALQEMALKNSGVRKKILLIAPGSELVEQNQEKMVHYGYPASIFCAGAGYRDHGEDFIFANPETINSKDRLQEILEYDFAGVFLDECHRLSPMVLRIIEAIREKNPQLRVVGVTATPYRLGEGYIYRHDATKGITLSDMYCRDPWFSTLVYSVSPHYLIDRGYIVPPVFGDIVDQYDTSQLRRDKTLKWTSESEKKVFTSTGARKTTKRIVQDIKRKMKTQGYHSCLIFAHNVDHARMILDIFHETKEGQRQAALITHHTEDTERKNSLEKFRKRHKLRYLINVSVLTTGFDVEHVDMIAILRATDSVSLFQQILGRGMRLSPKTGKTHCLILDYANNLSRFSGSGDPFAPDIQAARPGHSVDREKLLVRCPQCDHVNAFIKAALPTSLEADEYGYLYTVEKQEPVVNHKGEQLAGHHGQQCQGYVPSDETGLLRRCTHRWSSKECPACGELNSAYDAFCTHCTEPLTATMGAIRPSAAASKDVLYTERRGTVEAMTWQVTQTKKGVSCVTLDCRVRELPYLETPPPDEEEEDPTPRLVEPEPTRIKIWLSPHWSNPAAQRAWSDFVENCIDGGDIQKPEDLRSSDIRFRPPAYVNYRQKPPRSEEDRMRFHEILQFH
ncbi:DEAD/DEAH box helicase [Thioalkalivibrio sp. ALE23]|uniref:DEAD/DEAH box helicase n=1 Tax=Thioalkalivibrio sp. ALE23 TaxID=1265495 RepID=UPI0003768C2A|nr:DEAD/DEAH box helicase [Thioalkalivibrio sp. ALE23]